MKAFLSLLFVACFSQAQTFAQAPLTQPSATKSIQESETPSVIAVQPTPKRRELKIPAGTALEIEAAHTVQSVNIRPNDYLSFRTLVPIKIDGAIVIPVDALVTGRVVESKRGGRWGKAGKLSWIMLDVVATDLSRIPVRPNQELPGGRDHLRGISHGGEVAVKTAAIAWIPWLTAPALIGGAFKRGEDAIMPEGARFVVYVAQDSVVSVPVEP